MSGIEAPKDGRHPLNVLQDDIAVAMMEGLEEGESIPIVETTADVIAFYNRDSLKSYQNAGWFILKGVAVCEKGQKQIVRDKINKTLDPMPMVIAPPMLKEPK